MKIFNLIKKQAVLLKKQENSLEQLIRNNREQQIMLLEQTRIIRSLIKEYDKKTTK
jgi:hypothetical protein